MSCAQRGIDSATAAVDLEALGKACRVASSPPTVCTRGTPIANAGSTGPRTFGPSLEPGLRASVEMLGWVVMANALTMARYRAAEGLEAAA